MKVLVIGEGGREHAIVWSLRRSPRVTKIYCAPGNAGIAEFAECVDIKVTEIDRLVEFCRKANVHLTVVGPEIPLVQGIVDAFIKKGLRIVGPTKDAARLEGSKAYSKDFMLKHRIPTAKYIEINNMKEGLEALNQCNYPIVVKADGLAAGKGVIICGDKQEAEGALKKILVEKVFGGAGERAILEEYLEGIETSVLCFIDGKTLIPMVSSQDHKRIFDNDEGPNTGGMGTYSPNYAYTDDIAERTRKEILIPTLKGIQREGMDYKGILFVGLMITKDGPKVLEYNTRFGDPETQVVLSRLKTDLFEIFESILNEGLKDIKIQWTDDKAVCVVMASKGYPGSYPRNIEIHGLQDVEEDVMVFHSGTAKIHSQWVTNGGRVLGVTATGKSIEEARVKAYRNVAKIQFEGMQYRRDIGLK